MLAEIKPYLATLTSSQQRIDFLQQQQHQPQQQQQQSSTDLPIEQQGQLLHLLAIEQEVNHDLDGAIDSYTQEIALLTPYPLSEALIKSYIERSFILYLQTNDPLIYCPDRVVAITLGRQLGEATILAEALAQSAYFIINRMNLGKVSKG